MDTPLARSAQIFAQLAHAGEGHPVRTLIETHDAWVHADHALISLSPQLRAIIENMPRPPAVTARITRQRAALAPLVIHSAQLSY